ncbi:sugar kinase [Nocardioides phosphati]|uniref:Sugar kinase n=1 Tax=Nocardioides phosphati TaxID=1867775 RepID=A0ABQ2NAE6_9ACTN|nr:ROK family protein [Nocardioides phosphati]GGO90454.1 sugar kinase [Nocardioides phosphati]
MAGGGATALPTAGGVLDLIRRGDVRTRADVASVTGLSRTAVTARLSALLGSGLVVEGGEAPSTGGRPATFLQFNGRAGSVLAVAVGRSRTQLAVCDLAGEVLATAEFDHADGLEPDALFRRVDKRLGALLAEAGVARDSVRGVGLSLPGIVDAATATCVSAPVLRGWDGVALAPYFSSLEGAVVHVENDAKALALSEAHGHLLEHPDLVVLKASTGLGCGVFVQGRLVRGAKGAAGEIGHTKNPGADGRTCRCGEVGCIEAVAAGWALVQDSIADGVEVAHVRELADLAVAGDAVARRRIRESGRRVGEVLAGVVNLLNPGAIVVGGDLAAAYDIFVAGLRETLYAGAAAGASNDLVILPATHGAAAGTVGCAQLAIADVLSPAAVDALLNRD